MTYGKARVTGGPGKEMFCFWLEKKSRGGGDEVKTINSNGIIGFLIASLDIKTDRHTDRHTTPPPPKKERKASAHLSLAHLWPLNYIPQDLLNRKHWVSWAKSRPKQAWSSPCRNNEPLVFSTITRRRWAGAIRGAPLPGEGCSPRRRDGQRPLNPVWTPQGEPQPFLLHLPGSGQGMGGGVHPNNCKPA